MYFNGLQGKSKVISWCCLMVIAALLVACGSKQLRPAPVEDRTVATGHKNTTDPAEPAQGAKPGQSSSVTHEASAAAAPTPAGLPGAENAGKPGYYTVKQGDTLARIGLEVGQPYSDIARWNNLENPNRIETGQVLRIIPPGAPEEGAVARPVAASKASASPLPPAGKPAQTASTHVLPASAPTPAIASAAGAMPAAVVEEDVSFIWPVRGDIVATFDEAKNRKGLDIGGVAGAPILAAADGKVVYAGSSLRGYGNLIILKHSATYLTAYAHTQALLVKEEQMVKQGQKIAEMGNSDADQVKLHFEVRKLGKPVDPAKYLPIR